MKINGVPIYSKDLLFWLISLLHIFVVSYILGFYAIGVPTIAVYVMGFTFTLMVAIYSRSVSERTRK